MMITLFECQILIQLGDVLDRGKDEIAILYLLKSLDMQAKTEGGAVFQVCVVNLQIFLVNVTYISDVKEIALNA